MPEIIQKGPVLDYIHTIATGNNKIAMRGVNSALKQYERFLITLLRERPGGMIPQLPIMVEPRVFTQLTTSYPELNGDTPPVAIFKTVTKDTGNSLGGEIEVFRRVKKKITPQPTDVFVLREEDVRPTSEDQRLYRADRQVIDGEIFTSVSALRRGGVELGYRRLETLLADLPKAVAISKNFRPVTLFSEQEAERAITQWIEEAARRSTLRESRVVRLDPAVWAKTAHYANVYDISPASVRRILHDTAESNEGKTRFYRRDQADDALRVYFSRKRINGLYFRENVPHVTLAYLAERTAIDREKLQRELISLATRDVKDPYTLYPLADSVAIIDKITGIPHVAADGIYTDDARKRWAAATVIVDLLGISGVKVKEYLEGAEKMPVRGNRGKTTAHNVSPAYDVDDITVRATSYLSRPTLKDVMRDGSSLIIAEDLVAEYKLPVHVIRALLSSIGTPLRDDKVKTAYPRQDARTRLDTFKALPKMDRKKRQYMDGDRKVYVAKNEARRRLHTSDAIINEGIDSGDVQYLTARGELGTFELYSLADLQEFKKRPRKRRTRSDKISPEALIEEGRAIIANGEPLDSTLRQTHPGFAARVYRNFPGRMDAMRVACRVGDSVNSGVQYAAMTEVERNGYIEREGSRIKREKGIGLTPSELRGADEQGFEIAARRYYTKDGGGLDGLNTVLDRKKSDN